MDNANTEILSYSKLFLKGGHESDSSSTGKPAATGSRVFLAPTGGGAGSSAVVMGNFPVIRFLPGEGFLPHRTRRPTECRKGNPALGNGSGLKEATMPKAQFTVQRTSEGCSHCGTQLRPLANFCPRCGGQISRSPKSSSNPTANINPVASQHRQDQSRPGFCICGCPLGEGGGVCPASGVFVA